MGAVVDYIRNYDQTPREKIDPGTAVMIHAGSGRQYAESMSYANESDIPYIQASTKREHEMPLPDQVRCVFVEAPNLSVPIIKFMHMLRQHGSRFSGYDVTVTESHQQAKRSVAGTALALAGYLGVNPSEVQSIRNPDIQRNTLGIRNLGLHACHILAINESDCTITLETRVEGHATYINGLAQIILGLPQLESGFYKANDLVQAGVI